MKTTLTWGAAAVAMVWSSLGAAQIPPKPAPSSAPTPSGAAGTPSAPNTSAPSAVPSADPTAPAPPTTEPAPTEVAPTPVPAPPDAQAPAAEPAEDIEERPKKRKKKKRKPRYEEDQYEDAEHAADVEPEEEEEQRPRPRRSSWRLGGQHFVLSAERLTSVLTWSQSAKQEVPDTNSNFAGGTTTFESEVSGTDVGFLGAGASMDRNPFSMPRVGFDGIFDNGLTLGGSLSYMVTSGEQSSAGFGDSSTRELETLSVFLLAPRVGVLIPASATVGVWLRGGVTRLNSSSERPATSEVSGVDASVTYWDLTLDPQLVISPVPHIGITIGAALDIGISGAIESSTNSTTSEPELSASSYGVTAGLAAIF